MSNANLSILKSLSEKNSGSEMFMKKKCPYKATILCSSLVIEIGELMRISVY